VATQRQDTAVESVRHLTSQRHPDCRSACGRIGLREWRRALIGVLRRSRLVPVARCQWPPPRPSWVIRGGIEPHYRTEAPNHGLTRGLGQSRTASTCRPPAAPARRDSRLGMRRSVPRPRSYERAVGPGSTCSGYCEVRQTRESAPARPSGRSALGSSAARSYGASTLVSRSLACVMVRRTGGSTGGWGLERGDHH